MDYQEILRLINLNNSFYIKHQEEFSKSRRNSWKGWSNVIDIVNFRYNNKKNINILDVGCGNGRLYNFLSQNLHSSINYLGIDNNDYFLLEGILKYKNANFRKLDVLVDINKVSQKFNLICIFGLTHHIPDKDFRISWFNKIANLADQNSIIVISFWDLLNDPRSKKLIKLENYQSNDYYYGWSDSIDLRYVHIYNDDELSNIKTIFYDKGFKLENEYLEDGKSHNLNKYLIFSL